MREHQKLMAAWKKLQAAVEAGELTKEQARQKMAAMKKQALADMKRAAPRKGGKQRPKEANKQQQRLMAQWKKLQAAVKAGKLTEEQAKQKMAALKKRAAAAQKRAAQKKKATQKKKSKNKIGEVRVVRPKSGGGISVIRGSNRIVTQDKDHNVRVWTVDRKLLHTIETKGGHPVRVRVLREGEAEGKTEILKLEKVKKADKSKRLLF